MTTGHETPDRTPLVISLPSEDHQLLQKLAADSGVSAEKLAEYAVRRFLSSKLAQMSGKRISPPVNSAVILVRRLQEKAEIRNSELHFINKNGG